jgi:hypothetical protein
MPSSPLLDPTPRELIHIRLPKPLADDHRRLAATTERSMTATACIAIREHVQHERQS